MGQRAKPIEHSTQTHGKSRLTPALAGVGGPCLLAALLSLPALPGQAAEQASAHSPAYLTQVHADDQRAQPHKPHHHGQVDDSATHHHIHKSTLLDANAYQDAPDDVVLWGDLARAMVVRKGSTYQATFLPPVLALDGKTLSLIGFVTPTDAHGKPIKQFLLSDHAFMCDECEAPTPTGLVEVNTKDYVLVDQGRATVRGQFEVVKNDANGLVYRLNNATILKQQAD